MNVHTSLGFQLGFHEPPSAEMRAPCHVRAGLRAEVDGTVLTRYEDDSHQWASSERYDADGDLLTDDDYGYKGEYAFDFVAKLLAAVEDIHSTEGRFDEQVITLSGDHDQGAAIVLSYLDEHVVRIAFQNVQGWPSPPLAAALGKPVSTDALVEAAIDVGIQYRTYADGTNIEPGHDRTEIAELTRLLRND